MRYRYRYFNVSRDKPVNLTWFIDAWGLVCFDQYHGYIVRYNDIKDSIKMSDVPYRNSMVLPKKNIWKNGVLVYETHPLFNVAFHEEENNQVLENILSLDTIRNSQEANALITHILKINEI